MNGMKSLEEYLTLAESHHGHICPGQVLGIRMAMLGLRLIGIADPGAHRKRLLTFVEIDRCATDAIALVTGCRLGSRSLKFVDYGKMAATFLDLETQRAVRVAARDDARERAKAMFPELASPYRQQLQAYKIMPESDLFNVQTVRVKLNRKTSRGRRTPEWPATFAARASTVAGGACGRARIVPPLRWRGLL